MVVIIGGLLWICLTSATLWALDFCFQILFAYSIIIVLGFVPLQTLALSMNWISLVDLLYQYKIAIRHLFYCIHPFNFHSHILPHRVNLVCSIFLTLLERITNFDAQADFLCDPKRVLFCVLRGLLFATL